MEYCAKRFSKVCNLSDNATMDPAILNMASVMMSKVKITMMNAIKTEFSLKLIIGL